MEKKELKWYEAPAVEIVEMETAGSMLAGSGEDVDDLFPPTTGGGMNQD